MLDIDAIPLSKEREEPMAESDEAAASMRRLLGTDDVDHDAFPEAEVAPVYEPLSKGEVRFIHVSGQNISTILADGTHVEFPTITDDKDLIEELTAWSTHVGCMDVTTYADEQDAQE